MSGGAERKISMLNGKVDETAVEHIVAHLIRRAATAGSVHSLFEEHIAVVRMDTLCFLETAVSRNAFGRLFTGSYAAYCDEGLKHIHPDDWKAFWELRGPESLRRAYAEGKQGLECRYRVMTKEGDCRHLLSRVFFTPKGPDAVAVIVMRDTGNRNLAQPLDTVPGFIPEFGESCAEIYEVDLLIDKPTLLFSSNDELIPVDIVPGADIESVGTSLVHPDDRAEFITRLNGRTVHAAYIAGATEVTAEYRRLGMDGAWHWIASVQVPMRGPSGEPTDRAMLFNRDVTSKKHEEQHRRISEKYDQALRNIYDEVYELNVTRDTYRILYHVRDKYVIPPKAGRLSEAMDMVAHGMIHPQDRRRFLEFFDIDAVRERFAAGEECSIGEFRKLWMDGWFHWASLTLFPVERMEGEDEIFLVFIMDIDSRKRSEEIAQQNAILERQRLADERYKIIVEQTRTLVFEWTTGPGTGYISPEMSRQFCGLYDQRDVLTVWAEDAVIHPDDRGLFDAFLRDSRKLGHVEMTVRLKRRNGTFVWCKVSLSGLRGQDANEIRYIGTLNDVDDATRSVLALRYRAEYDTLTGILNMQTFYSRAAQLIRNNPESQYYVIRMDIDRFKVINDLFGMEEGDCLLKTIAAAMSERMNANSVCARMSGDVFCACVDFSRTEVIDLVRGLSDRIAAYPLSSRIVPSFGICRVDNVDTPISVLCDWANLALKTVKGQVLHYYAFYDETLRERMLEERKIESNMHAALQNGEFCLYLQPKVDIQSSRIVGAESLVRWNNPEEGIIAPDNFIPLFERNGFVIRLDEFIWEESCKLLRRWKDAGRDVLPLSVNVSRMHIHDTRFCEKLPRLLAKYDLPTNLLELELTESVFLDNADEMVNAINELRTHGFVFSLDDFGAGYSSLNMLKTLPIDIIKIDRGFLTEVVATDRGKTVIRHIIALARALNMQVVAEGVENQGHADFLLEVDCGLAQGYHYSRPLPVAEFERLAFGEVYTTQASLTL